MKLKIVKIIITDDEGFLVLKGLLPDGSILWSRNVDGQIAVYIDDYINLEYLEKNLNTLYKGLNH